LHDVTSALINERSGQKVATFPKLKVRPVYAKGHERTVQAAWFRVIRAKVVMGIIMGMWYSDIALWVCVMKDIRHERYTS
jgi:hypothetical protein